MGRMGLMRLMGHLSLSGHQIQDVGDRIRRYADTPIRRYADTLPLPTGGQKSERAREFVHDVEFGAGVPAVVGP
jgi:hypothetical protein